MRNALSEDIVQDFAYHCQELHIKFDFYNIWRLQHRTNHKKRREPSLVDTLLNVLYCFAVLPLLKINIEINN